jgi:hypothetical protein
MTEQSTEEIASINPIVIGCWGCGCNKAVRIATLTNHEKIVINKSDGKPHTC